MANNVQQAFAQHVMNNITAIGLFNNGTELSGSNYSRITINPSQHLELTSDANNFYIRNKVNLSFPQAAGDWGTFNQVGVFGAGTTLWFLIDVPSRTIRQYDQVFIETGKLELPIPKVNT